MRRFLLPISSRQIDESISIFYCRFLPAKLLTSRFHCRFLPAKLTSRFLLPISSRQIDESIILPISSRQIDGSISNYNFFPPNCLSQQQVAGQRPAQIQTMMMMMMIGDPPTTDTGAQSMD
jgi:hypothetical protein